MTSSSDFESFFDIAHAQARRAVNPHIDELLSFDDLFGVALEALVYARRKFDGRGSERAFVASFIRRRVIDYERNLIGRKSVGAMRKESLFTRLDDLVRERRVDSHESAVATRVDHERRMMRLTRRQRQMIELRQKGYTHQEIATRLDIGLASSWVYQNGAKKRYLSALTEIETL